jgi:hypothetical protein
MARRRVGSQRRQARQEQGVTPAAAGQPQGHRPHIWAAPRKGQHHGTNEARE